VVACRVNVCGAHAKHLLDMSVKTSVKGESPVQQILATNQCLFLVCKKKKKKHGHGKKMRKNIDYTTTACCLLKAVCSKATVTCIFSEKGIPECISSSLEKSIEKS